MQLRATMLKKEQNTAVTLRMASLKSENLIMPWYVLRSTKKAEAERDVIVTINKNALFPAAKPVMRYCEKSTENMQIERSRANIAHLGVM
ncbi:hypothetical protein [Foetidibacter luteolus]|uniref:hypothetical protein n=1 Tax=Foetidibacter luteolus TaxID=2608880 RepID=UPI001A987DC7|nr:hypothetical protein [Foetidibacter luteolus]